MRHLRLLIIPLLSGALWTGGLSFRAQGNFYPPDQINQLVAPVALYPDALMSQVLMAATFPEQVTQANQWLQGSPGLTGRVLDDALATATWDPSIIALCKFPTALDRMAQNIAWTTDLGIAFLNQRTEVIDAVQVLRSEAYRNGNLRTTPQQRVVVQGPEIVIQPYTPEVIYVPTYQPAVVYGSYWNYPSYYYPSVWDPWPGYSFVNGFAWGIGFAFGNILFGGCDWGHHSVYVNNNIILNNGIYHNTPYYREGHCRGGYDRQPWEHHGDNRSYARGGSGEPYGGRSNERVRGTGQGPSDTVRRGIEPTAIRAPRGEGGNAGIRPTRPASNGTAQAATRTTSRSAIRQPIDFSEQGHNRLATQGTSNYPIRGANRPAAHGPTGISGEGASRAALHGTSSYPTRGGIRQPVQPTSGYSQRSSGRPTVNGTANYAERGATRTAPRSPLGYSGQGASRPSLQPPRDYARPTYNRPSAQPSRGYSRPGTSGPAARPQASYTRPNSGGSYARPSAGGSVGHGGGGYGGGGRQAPSAPSGGQRGRGHR